MQKVDLIFKNARVLTMDSELRQFEPGAVAIKGDEIVAVDKEDAILKKYDAREEVNCQDKVLMPGLVNAHTHVPMTLLRGVADDLRLDVWLLGHMMPVEREFVSPEFVRLGTLMASAELIRSGVTTFADMYYYEEQVAQAAAEAGLRAVCGETVIKFPSPDAQSYEESLEYTRDFIKRWRDHPLITPSVAPHAPYTCTTEILQAATELALEFDIPVQIHLAETRQEVETMRREHGIPVIPYIRKIGMLEAKIIGAHLVHVDEGEMHTLKNFNVGVVHNPSSNLKLASGFAKVSQMSAMGVNVGIGTDGPASNNDLDMFEEMRLASFIAKGITNDPTALPAPHVLTMATRIGAQALHLDKQIGSIEVGKKADLILIDTSAIHNSPRYKREDKMSFAQIVYATKTFDVTDVLVNGKFLMRDKKLLTLDEESLLKEAQNFARRIDSFLLEREKSVLSKLIAIETATEEESFEVQIKVPVKRFDEIFEKLKKPEIKVVYQRHYLQYDTYFYFDDADQGRLRYREDEIINPQGQIVKARYRLTLLGPAFEREFAHTVLLSRSRYLAKATHSLRFYREYFKPIKEMVIEKERYRWKVVFKETEFYINLDRLVIPKMGDFLEIKSRTWSRHDAEEKAVLVADLLKTLGLEAAEPIGKDYSDLALE
ncbi:amidohydrolase family protein [Calditrichota bacterium LG25]